MAAQNPNSNFYEWSKQWDLVCLFRSSDFVTRAQTVVYNRADRKRIGPAGPSFVNHLPLSLSQNEQSMLSLQAADF
jgi:hypothetical protein